MTVIRIADTTVIIINVYPAGGYLNSVIGTTSWSP